MIIHKRLVDYWEKFDMFTTSQFGFRRNHSTNLAITHLYEKILQQRDENKLVCGIFLDIHLQQTDPKLQKDQLCIIQFQTKRTSNSILYQHQ